MGEGGSIVKAAHRRAHVVLWLLVTTATLAMIVYATFMRQSQATPGPSVPVPLGAPEGSP